MKFFQTPKTPIIKYVIALTLLNASLTAVVMASVPSRWFSPREHQAEGQAAERVVLIIDYGDHTEKRFTAIPFKMGMTVNDTLIFAQNGPRGLKIQSRGEGEFLFIEAIDNMPNEGAGKGKRNWVYKLNNILAKRGAGSQTLSPGDEVRWIYSASGLKESLDSEQPSN